METLGPMLDILCLKLIAVPNEEALARNRARLVPRVERNVHYPKAKTEHDRALQKFEKWCAKRGLTFTSALLELAVLLFQALQLADVGDLHPAMARPPLVKRRIADAVLPAQIARRKPGGLFLQNLDDLLFGEIAGGSAFGANGLALDAEVELECWAFVRK